MSGFAVVSVKDRGIFAICDTIERAQRWLDEFNPAHYIDKTLRREDFAIEPYAPAPRRRK
jgi:hypothetical protein